jgi:hypothetical protein
MIFSASKFVLSAYPRQFASVWHLYDSPSADFGCHFHRRHIAGLYNLPDYTRLFAKFILFADIQAVIS